jgi:hypothetical protein
MARRKHADGGAPEARMEQLEEDNREGRASEKYNAVGSKTEKEAMSDDYGGHKRGGKAKRERDHEKRAAGGPVMLANGGMAGLTGAPAALKRGGKVHHGSMPMHVDGKAPRHHRMDRPGRKRGGGIGADTSPMTAAARLTAPRGEHDQTKTDARDD